MVEFTLNKKVFSIRKGRNPSAFYQAGIPANVIYVQVSTQNDVNVFGPIARAFKLPNEVGL